MSSIRTIVPIAAIIATLALPAATAAQEAGVETYKAAPGGEAKTPAVKGSLQGAVSTATSGEFQAATPAAAGAVKDGAAAGNSTLSVGTPAGAVFDPTPRGAAAKETAADTVAK